MTARTPLALLLALTASVRFAGALESEPAGEGALANLQLVTAAGAVIPGEPFTVGILFEPKPEHHIYWRGPGIVGVAPLLEWTLPRGFSAGDIAWPPPKKVDMAGITANGYHGETCLLVEIEVPEKIEGDTVTLETRCAWMACAVSCHPGVKDLSLTIPVAHSKAEAEKTRDEKWAARFRAIRETIPPAAPQGWSLAVNRPADDRVALDVTVPGWKAPENPGVLFYSDDMQVDSDEPLRFRWLDREAGSFRLVFHRPDFAPGSPPRFSGLLEGAAPWPGTGSRWVEISVPWKKGDRCDE